MRSLIGDGSELDDLDHVLGSVFEIGEDELDQVFDVISEDGEDDDEEEEGEEGDKEMMEGEDLEAEKVPVVNPLVSIEGEGAGVEFSRHFGSCPYEALAEKKRRVLADSKGCSEGSRKKARLEDDSRAYTEELIFEALTYGVWRRKSRKRRKNGRRKGSKKELSPEIDKMLLVGVVHYVDGRYEEAIHVLTKVGRLAPDVSDSYRTLGRIYDTLGDFQKANRYYELEARIKSKDSTLWKELFTRHKQLGNLPRAMMCLSRAVRAEPSDPYLRSLLADFHWELGDYQKAAEACEQVVKICPDDLKALRRAVEFYSNCGQSERSVGILESCLKDHPSEVNSGVIIEMLAVRLMETKNHDSALKHIEHAQQAYHLGKELGLHLRIKAGICHAHLGDIDKAESFFCSLQKENDAACLELITEVADAFRSLGHFHSALKYYHMLDVNGAHDNDGSIHFKIAECHQSLNNRVEAVEYFYRALPKLSNSVDARLALASLLLEDSKEDDAIALLSTPETCSEVNFDPGIVRLKMKLCQIHRAKGMREAFVNILLPLVHKSLEVKTRPPKAKKRLTTSTLRKRIKILDVGGTDDVFGGVRPLASRSDRMKAARARRMLEMKEEQKAAARAKGIDWNSDVSDDEESATQEVQIPPLPNLLEDEEHYSLIIDLCKALQSLQRYWEALEIISLARKLTSNKLTSGKKEELLSLAAQISYYTTDPKHALDCVKSVVQQRPYSFAAWNCYYKLTSRLEKKYSRKFLRYMRAKHKDCVPPIVISGHQFAAESHHQDASKQYLEAYKLLPENPLVNLCAGTGLINLALGFRLQNRHQCVAQGLAFLHNNLRLTGGKNNNTQEALYNIARGYQQVGMSTLAVSYYEKVLSMSQNEYPIPTPLLNEGNSEEGTEAIEPEGAYCDLRREAAYNLHLIYMRSGALGLARQVLKNHCTAL